MACPCAYLPKGSPGNWVPYLEPFFELCERMKAGGFEFRGVI